MSDPFAGVDDDAIGTVMWELIQERIGGEEISDWLRARGHGWMLTCRPRPYARVWPLDGAEARRQHGGETIDIKRTHDGSRRGGYLALYRCFDAAVSDLSRIVVPTTAAPAQLEMAVGS